MYILESEENILTIGVFRRRGENMVLALTVLYLQSKNDDDHKKEDDLKNKGDLKQKDDLKNEGDPKTKVDLEKENNLINEDDHRN